MINYLIEHFPLYVMCAFFTLYRVAKSWVFNLIIEVSKEILVSFIAGLIKNSFKKKED